MRTSTSPWTSSTACCPRAPCSRSSGWCTPWLARCSSFSPGRCGSRPHVFPNTATRPTCCASWLGHSSISWWARSRSRPACTCSRYSCRATGAPHRRPPEAMTEALVGLAAMMLLAFVRIPIAVAMAVVGVVGYAYMRDWSWSGALAMAQTKVYETGRNYTLSVVPLFILMGNFVTRAGMSQELFRAAYAFIGHLRGGLAMATIVGCAGFGAICGSSIATAATFAKVAYPSMKKFGYADYLSTGAIAAGGTLGILIPPSTIMVIYGIMTETNIGKLFAAGILPGVLATVLLCLAVRYITWRDPKAGPPGERMSWRERLATLEGLSAFAAVGVALVGVAKLGWLEADDAAVIGAFIVFGLALVYKGVTSVIALFTLVMGGIYGGVFTAIEGAAIGAFGAMVFAIARRTLRPQMPPRTVCRGVLAFMAADCVRLAILVAFPVISTYLPGMMK